MLKETFTAQTLTQIRQSFLNADRCEWVCTTCGAVNSEVSIPASSSPYVDPFQTVISNDLDRIRECVAKSKGEGKIKEECSVKKMKEDEKDDEEQKKKDGKKESNKCWSCHQERTMLLFARKHAVMRANHCNNDNNNSENTHRNDSHAPQKKAKIHWQDTKGFEQFWSNVLTSGQQY